jgi:YVTN family beta-propeller protein
VDEADPNSTKLAYAILPDQNPIRATAPGTDPNVVSLQVIVSNPTLSAVTLKVVTIEIPTGEDTSRAISPQPNLPPPLYDTTIPWTISTTGELVTIVPSTGPSGSVTGPIVFTLPSISVNQTPGSMPITITEAGSSKIVDSNTYRIVKQPADFPVTRFWADPPSLDTIEQPITLYWSCTEDGQHDAYGLEIVSTTATRPEPDSAQAAPAAGLQFKNCIADGDCYTWHDGQSGVSTAPISQTTTFALDVVQMDSAGNRRVLDTLQAVVQVTLPYFSRAASQTLSPSGRLVRLQWLAFNAAYCTVELDCVPIDGGAPVDTYQSGYLAILTAAPGLHQLSVVANAATGGAQVPYLFSSFQIGAPVAIAGPQAQAVAITPDGRHALVGTWGDDTVSLLDIAKRTHLSPTVTVPDPSSIAITPDGTTAVVTGIANGTVHQIDIPSMTQIGSPITVGGNPSSVAITPDGKWALAVNIAGQAFQIPIRGGTYSQIAMMRGSASGIAITPDGKHALVTLTDTGGVAFLNLTTHQVDATVSVGDVPSEIAVTPDGTFALVSNTADWTISVIDLASRTVEAATIPAGEAPTSVAISSDGRVALVANGKSNEVTVVDIPARSSQSLSLGYPTDAVAIARDGSFALLASGDANLVALI